MAFVTDKQTLEDLSIFSRTAENSVYSLFNRTCTAGGAAILEELFMYPLSNAAAINDRAAIIRQFSEWKSVFPCRADLFGIAEQYLSNTDQRTRLSAEENTIGKRLINLVTPDSEYQLLYKGAVSLKEILTAFRDFIHSLELNDDSSYKKDKDKIILLLNEPELQHLLQKRSATLPYEQLAEHDVVFRYQHRSLIRQILQFVYLLDAYIAIAKTANEHGFCFPNALPGKEKGLEIQAAWHPLLKKPVANSIQLMPGKNIVFLTGANMAGKSTLMKSLGICVLLAHMGFPVPAARMEFSVMDGLYSTINLSDNLGLGTSHFYAEVMRIKKIAKELSLSKDLFVIFDELFRGTNVKDAYEATIAVIAAFAKRSTSLFVVSTHIIEAGAVLKEQCGNIQFVFLPTRIVDNIPAYTYKLEQGITKDRHGMVIIKNEGILDILKRRKKQET
jgi:DNA mismatch repair ATPase MutS